MTAKQAGVYYLTVVCPSNEVQYKFWDSIDGKYSYEIDLGKARQLAKARAVDLRASARYLQRPPLKWPAKVSRDVDQVSQVLLGKIRYYNDLGSAETADEHVALSNSFPADKNAAAEQVRLTLNLPPAGGCPDWANEAKKPTMIKPS